MVSFSSNTKAEIKCIKKIFNELDKIIESEKKRDEQLSDKEIKELDFQYRYRIKNLRQPLGDLAFLEVTYDSFVKFVTDEEYLKILKKVYDENEEYIGGRISFLRLQERPSGSKREAIKEMKAMCKNKKEQFNLAARILFSNEVNNTAEETVYALRDWLRNDFDNLVDTIEPVRQEYIISRKGNVKEEEIEAFLSDKFENYHVYEEWVRDRRSAAFVYYPDLKIK